MSLYEMERLVTIAKTEKFLSSLCIDKVKESFKEKKRKREKKIPVENLTKRLLSSRSKTSVVPFSKLLTEERLYKHCDKCGWKSSLSFQSVAAAALLEHQKSGICKEMAAEKNLPSKDKTFQRDRKAAQRQKKREGNIRLRKHNSEFVEVHCPIRSCNFRKSVKNSSTARLNCLKNHRSQKHGKDMTIPVLAEIGEVDFEIEDAGGIGEVSDDDVGPNHFGEDGDEDSVSGGHVEQCALDDRPHCNPATTPNQTIWEYQQIMVGELTRPRTLRLGKNTQIMLYLLSLVHT
jgi:hypothetical protein